MELVIVAVAVAAAALMVGRRVLRTWRRASVSRPVGAPPCAGGGCDGCEPSPEPPSARLVQLGRRRGSDDRR